MDPECQYHLRQLKSSALFHLQLFKYSREICIYYGVSNCIRIYFTAMAKLLTRFVSVIMICEPVDTAETSADAANLPTINRSIAPYIACKNRANSTGSANKINGCKILPWVKVVFFSIFSILCSYGSTGRQLPHKKGWIRHGHFSPASYPAIVYFEQSTLRWLIASIARAVWSVNHIYCTFAHQMYTFPCYRPPDSSSILFIFCCNGGCALSGASSGKAV